MFTPMQQQMSLIRLTRIGRFSGSLRYFTRGLSGNSSMPLKQWIGSKFNTLDEVKQFMQQDSASIEEYLNSDSARTTSSNLDISDETIRRLLKLSGLPTESVDILHIKKRLKYQMSFLNKLQEISYDTDKIDENNSRILPRNSKPLSYEELISKIERATKSEDLGEVSNSWNPTELSALSRNKMYVLRGGLMKDRE
ncbi:hypothetical protein TPHA_0D03010 [Tetrapisispora phaffii CBS 4417]|uniref:Glutamyl-tRNA(Gln) amidotransferase subunit F, mitochondrial n=1 Tax=Tetrapisispora phaffii (strain ATCC 24235 / CBS 4417 / NBRC 1672 / NRRL Y-8282 / UCD 70-5) TaxID=1071381 RepID=G8BSW6_TETPH|nr:hypothetical protein TPHA_0D03010 [Tetrapisispora phaffii CBS 4417]CCE62937.1 hypothetical protein TPHA_0D03010 [Tetrapisispora phaffii CBS 4417]